MAKPKKMRNLLGVLKDKVSLIKVTLLLTNTRTSSLHVAVLRATSHSPSDSPPSDIDDILALAIHHHRPTSSALLHALLRRVHRTSDAYVALKCLLTLHHIFSRGSHSPLLNDQIFSFAAPQNDRPGPLFGLSNFMDQSDTDTRELSNWVRWYAATLNHKIFLPSTKSLVMLIKTLEQISGSPETLHLQRISLIYEVMKLIGEDYRIIMRDIHTKVEAYSKSIHEFREDSLSNFLDDLRRIEACKEKLFLMFLNKKNNDGVWELIQKVRNDAEMEKQRRENMKIVTFQGNDSTTQREASRVEVSKTLAVIPVPRGRRWLDVEWNKLVVVPAV